MDAATFDDWYANMARSQRLDAIVQQALGLPPEMESSSLLSWDGIADVVDLLGVTAGDLLVDLACGRGGYGLEIARRTGVRLVGVDFSAVAIERARSRADVPAEFVVGDLTATGLPADSVDAIVCVDAMQFAEPYAAGIAESLRNLKPDAALACRRADAVGGRRRGGPGRRPGDRVATSRGGGGAALDRPQPPGRRPRRPPGLRNHICT